MNLDAAPTDEAAPPPPPAPPNRGRRRLLGCCLGFTLTPAALFLFAVLYHYMSLRPPSGRALTTAESPPDWSMGAEFTTEERERSPQVRLSLTEGSADPALGLDDTPPYSLIQCTVTVSGDDWDAPLFNPGVDARTVAVVDGGRRHRVKYSRFTIAGETLNEASEIEFAVIDEDVIFDDPVGRVTLRPGQGWPATGTDGALTVSCGTVPPATTMAGFAADLGEAQSWLRRVGPTLADVPDAAHDPSFNNLRSTVNQAAGWYGWAHPQMQALVAEVDQVLAEAAVAQRQLFITRLAAAPPLGSTETAPDGSTYSATLLCDGEARTLVPDLPPNRPCVVHVRGTLATPGPSEPYVRLAYADQTPTIISSASTERWVHGGGPMPDASGRAAGAVLDETYWLEDRPQPGGVGLLSVGLRRAEVFFRLP